MKTALIVISYPYGRDREQEQQAWKKWSADADEQIKKAKGAERLDQSVWLVEVDTGLRFLAWLIASATAQGLKPRSAFLDETPRWIQT